MHEEFKTRIEAFKETASALAKQIDELFEEIPEDYDDDVWGDVPHWMGEATGHVLDLSESLGKAFRHFENEEEEE